MKFVSMIFLVACSLCYAQSPKTIMFVHYDEVHPHAEADYKDAMKEMADNYRTAGVDNLYWRMVAGSHSYAMVYAAENHGELDRIDEMVQKAWDKIGREKAEATRAKRDAATYEHYTECYHLKLGLSYMPQGSPILQQPGFFEMATVYVKPGQEKAFESVLDDVRNALIKIKHPLPMMVYQVGMGRGSYKVGWLAENHIQYHTVNDLQTMLVNALGAEEAKQLETRYNQVIHRIDSQDYRPMRELSYWPADQN